MTETDPGQHYRCKKRIAITQADIANGFVEADYSPYAIALAWGMTDHMEFFILKKDLRMGRSIKDKKQEMLDIINAAQQRIKAIDDEAALAKLEKPIAYEGKQQAETPWIKNTGVPPDCKEVQAKHRCGNIKSGRPSMFNWQITGDEWDVIEYQILDTENQAIAGDPEPTQKPHWIKNTGTKPNCKRIIAKFKDGEIVEDGVSQFIWNNDTDLSSIIEYLIWE